MNVILKFKLSQKKLIFSLAIKMEKLQKSQDTSDQMFSCYEVM